MHPCIGLDPTADLAVLPGPRRGSWGDTTFRASFGASTTNETT
jgi:hypothetical protein